MSDCWRYAGPWDLLCDLLRHNGVRTMFGLPGDDLAVLPAAERYGIEVVLHRDQRTAVFAATGYALASGRLGVCVVGKGPAVTNALTGLLEARASAAPVLLLAGGTPADRRGSGAFQELEQLPLASALCTWAARVEAPHRLLPTAEKALLVAQAGAPGPVYLEVPDSAPDTRVVRARPWSSPWSMAGSVPHGAAVEGTAATLAASRRPVVLAGGGLRRRVVMGHGAGVAEKLAERLGAALAVTASGRGGVREEHPAFCGVSGLYAPPATQALWRDTDLVIALGSRLEETATTGWCMPRKTPVVQVTLDPRDASTERSTTVVLSDAVAMAESWLHALGPADSDDPRREWRRRVHECRAEVLRWAADVPPRGDGVLPRVVDVLTALRRVAPADTLLVQENGLADMWSYWFPYWTCRRPGGSIVPSEQTSLGFGAAAAAGAWRADPRRPVVALVGDGAFDTLRPDLQTLARDGIGVVYVVLCNGGHGWLQAKWNRIGDGSPRFADPGVGPAPLPAEVHQVSVHSRGALATALRSAMAIAATRRLVVVNVPIALSDTAPGLEEIAGDFPAVRTADGSSSRDTEPIGGQQ